MVCLSHTSDIVIRLINTHISHVKPFAVMSFERSVIFPSAGDDPGPFHLSTQTVYPPWQRQIARLSFIGCNLRCGFLPSWRGLSKPCFAKSPVWRSKLLPNGTIIAREEYLRLVTLILLWAQRCQKYFELLWTWILMYIILDCFFSILHLYCFLLYKFEMWLLQHPGAPHTGPDSRCQGGCRVNRATSSWRWLWTRGLQ